MKYAMTADGEVGKIIGVLRNSNVVQLRILSGTAEGLEVHWNVSELWDMDEHFEIMFHTQKNQRFCGDSQEMQWLCNHGLMEFAYRKTFVPDNYYRLTEKGRKLLKGAL